MKNTTHIMNARIWKRAAGGPYKKKQKARNTLRTFYSSILSKVSLRNACQSRSFLPACANLRDLIIGDTGMSLLLQGLLFPLVAHQNYNFGKYKVVDSVAVRFLR